MFISPGEFKVMLSTVDSIFSKKKFISNYKFLQNYLQNGLLSKSIAFVIINLKKIAMPFFSKNEFENMLTDKYMLSTPKFTTHWS